jgi:RHS repeat-associated protein
LRDRSAPRIIGAVSAPQGKRLALAALVAMLTVAVAVAAPGLAASPRHPDLTVKALRTSTTSVTPGGKLAVTAKVADAGSKAPASTLAAYLGKGRKHSRSDVRLGTLATPALRPGKIASLKGNLTVPASTASGTYTLIACADSAAKVKEKNETNDCRAAATVRVGSAGAGANPGGGGGQLGEKGTGPGTGTTPGGGTPPGGEPPSEHPHEEPHELPSEEPAGGGLPGSGEPVPPPPAPPQVPPVPDDKPVQFAAATDFLYEGPNAIQTGVEDGAIEVGRAGVLHGRVLDTAGNPLPSVTVTVVDQPELGQTVTREDGGYELAVNSGGPIVLHFERPTYMPSDREIDPRVRNYEQVEDVAMRRYDADMTAIAPDASKVQVAQSSVTDDESGERRSTLIFMPGTTASMRLPDGTTKPLKAIHVRASEYTVGPRGPESMPGDLPATSAYTYAVNYSVDEAIEAGATGVQFNRPVPIYTDDFIGMPVGTRVPLGYYDTAKSEWVSESDGRVLKIVSIVGGKAELDIDGDGQADSGAALAALGITDEEREALAGVYGAGKELWRIQVTHFSAWDHNWGVGPPPGSHPPRPEPPKPKETHNPDDPLPDCKKQTGSAVDCDNQALREALPVAGTPFTLNYTSARSAAKAVTEVEIPVSEANIPAGITHISLDVEVAGHMTHVEFPAAPNLSYDYKWDGRDRYGRPVVGPTTGTATITYFYPQVYSQAAADEAASFASYPGVSLDVAGREEFRMSQTFEFTVRGRPVTPPSGLGGWSLSVDNVLDPASGVVELGTGDSMPAPVENVSRLLANRFEDQPPADLVQYVGATWQPDGSVWFLENFSTVEDELGHSRMKVRRVAPDGTISTIAPLPEAPVSGGYSLGGIAPAPDGGVYAFAAVSHVPNTPILHVAPNGTITKVTGGETFTNLPASPNHGDGMPASEAVLENPEQLLLGPGGALYIANIKRLQRINAVGTLETVFEVGVPGPGEEDFDDEGFAYGPDGSLYILRDIPISLDEGREVVRLYPSGEVETVLGGGTEHCCSNNQVATAASYKWSGPIAVNPDGNLVFGDGTFLDEVTTGGRIRQLAGGVPERFEILPGSAPAFGQRVTIPALARPSIAPDGRIAAVTDSGELRSIEPGVPGSSLSGYTVPSSDGSEVFRFDSSGRQTEIVDPFTGISLEKFAYTADGLLASVTDQDGRQTTIERNGVGEPTAILAPGGERTTVSLDAEGNLATVQRPGIPATRLTYGADGLLTGETDADGGVHTFGYDAAGLVKSDRDPDGVESTVSASEGPGGRTVTVTSPSGEATTYENGGSKEAGFHRTVTTPNGAKTVTTVAPDGTAVGSFPDGSTVTSVLGSDPRFGALGHLTQKWTSQQPTGSPFELTDERTTTLVDKTNPFSVNKLIDHHKLGSGSQATTEYDGPTRTLTVTESEGQRGTAKFDTKGHIVSWQGDLAETPATAAYDARGLVTETVQGANKRDYTYDSHDHLATATDALGHTFHYEYDEAGRVKSAELPGGEKYLLEHDGLDQLTKVTEPSGSASRLTFTPGGRVGAFVPPGSGSGYVNAYDADGGIESTTLPGGRKVTYGRDAGGRVTSVAFPEATVGVGYVGNEERVGSLTRTPTGGGTAETLQQGYNGGLPTSSEWSGAAAGATSVSYGENQQISQTKASAGASSSTTQISRDNDGRVIVEGPFRLRRSGPQGAITEISGGPLETSQTWDGFGRLGSRTDTVAGHQNYKMALIRDAAGQLTQKVETVAGVAHTYTYGYDVDGRLTDVHRDGALVEHYAYDADGNRTTREVEGASKAATYDAAGLITGLGGTAYTTTSDGFVTARGADAFTYATRGELLSATVGGTAETYSYDGFGRLVARTVGGTTWQYLYGNPEQQLQVTAAVEPDGTLDTLSYTDTGYLYSILRGATRYYVSTDQVGSPRVVTDAAGNVVKKVDYSAFGETLSDSAPSFELPLGYAGGIADPQAEIVHMGLRPYDPASGRFMARDPLGLGGGQANLFAYAGDEPIQHSDSIGMGSTALGLCDGFCVGVKFTITEKGFSSCVELGSGEGNEFEYNPNAELDENKFFAKATASAGFGGLLGGELGVESSVTEKCKETKLIGKVCTVGACVSPEGIAVDGYKVFEALAKPAKRELELKATVGVCQAVLW